MNFQDAYALGFKEGIQLALFFACVIATLILFSVTDYTPVINPL